MPPKSFCLTFRGHFTFMLVGIVWQDSHNVYPLSQLCFEAIFGSIDAQGLKVDIEPVKGVAFDILVLHLEVYLSVVITGKVDNNTAIFLFEQLAQVAGIH